jgi:hypothetical protein
MKLPPAVRRAILAYVKFAFSWISLGAIALYLIAVRGYGARRAYVVAVVAGYFFLVSASQMAWIIRSDAEFPPTARRGPYVVWLLVNANALALAFFLVPQIPGRTAILLVSVAVSALAYLRYRRAARRGTSR